MKFPGESFDIMQNFYIVSNNSAAVKWITSALVIPSLIHVLSPEKEELLKELFAEHPSMLDDDQYFVRLGKFFNLNNFDIFCHF